MKKVIFTLLTIFTFSSGVFAQYCGNSGPNVCTPSGDLNQPGLSPPSDSLPPVLNCVPATTTIQFKNFNTFFFGGTTITIQQLRIDTIDNLPAGVCWATNKSDNVYANQEDGCIKVSGTPQDSTGQYKLYIVVTADIGLGLPNGIQTNAEAANLKYFVRLVNSGQSAQQVDTLQTAPFVGYGPNHNCSVGINDVQESFSALSVVPNPFSGKAVVSFYSPKSGIMTERVTNMLGAEVYKGKVEVKVGENSTVLDRNTMPSGVYFYSLSDGKHVATKRVVITD